MKLRVVDSDVSDAELLRSVRAGELGASARLYDRFADVVNRVVWRVMGADSEIDDLVQQVFEKILVGIHRVEDPGALQGWVCSIAVYTVRTEIRRRKVRRLVRLTERVPESVGREEDHEGRDLVRRLYAILDRLPVDERLAFALRFIDDRPLVEVAELCDCSLATIKRRLARARKRFERHASKDPDFARRLKQGQWRRSGS